MGRCAPGQGGLGTGTHPAMIILELPRARLVPTLTGWARIYWGPIYTQIQVSLYQKNILGPSITLKVRITQIPPSGFADFRQYPFTYC